MERRFRLTSSTEIMRVRRDGKSYAHPLLVLIIESGTDPDTRFAVSAGRSIGNAVQRNRAKRLLRAALRDIIHKLPAGTRGVVVARRKLPAASLEEARSALLWALDQAGICPDC